MKQLALIVILSVIALVWCTPGQGVFTLNCVPLTVQRSDPIVQPGVASSHVHAVIGGNAFTRTMGLMDANKLANQTTCNKALDHSNYWVPQLYHQRADKMWEIVPFLGSSVYYQLRACDYAPGVKRCNATNLPLAFPDGFRMVAGDPLRRTQNDSDTAQRAVHMVCLTFDKTVKQYVATAQAPGFPTQHCNMMRAEVYFPSCWDGKNIDSDDHKTHVAYPAIGDYNTGVCPESHPVAIFSLFVEFFFNTGLFQDINKFAFANGDPTAFGYHADFMMGWTDRALLQTAHNDCLGPANCPKLGNQGQVVRPLIFPAVYEEEVGLHGPIASLPGNNPVVWPTEM